MRTHKCAQIYNATGRALQDLYIQFSDDRA